MRKDTVPRDERGNFTQNSNMISQCAFFICGEGTDRGGFSYHSEFPVGTVKNEASRVRTLLRIFRVLINGSALSIVDVCNISGC